MDLSKELIIKPYLPDKLNIVKKRDLISDEKKQQKVKLHDLRLKSDSINHLFDKVKHLEEHIDNYKKSNKNSFLLNMIEIVLFDYYTWALKQIRILSFTIQDEDLVVDSDKISNFMHKIVMLLNEFKCSLLELPSVDLRLKVASIDNTFLEHGLYFYITKLDPLALWIQGNELAELFKTQPNSFLSLAILLVLVQFSDLEMNERVEMEAHYHNYIKSNLSIIYANQNHNNLLVLVMLGFYEASYYKLINFKRYLSDSLRMSQSLGYEKIELNRDGDSLKEDNEKVSYRKKRRTYDLLVSTAYGLGFILIEPMIKCQPYNPNYTSIINDFNREPYFALISNLELVDKIPVLIQTSKKREDLLKLVRFFNRFENIVKQKFLNLSFKQIFEGYDQFKTKTNLYLQSQLQAQLVEFNESFQSGTWLNSLKILTQLACVHLNAGNWITFGPLHSIICSPMLITHPGKVYCDPITLIELIECCPRLLPLFFNEFEEWKDKATLFFEKE